MSWILIILIFSVFIRRYIPARGFLCDDVIAYITKFGNDRKIVIDDSPIVIKTGKPQVVKDTPEKKEPKKAEGIDLKDISAKSYKEVNTSYMYSNFDDKDEDLTSVVKKGVESAK